MALAAWFAQMILVVAFVVAAAAKTADLPGTRVAVGDFGVPRRAVPVVTALIPVLETATAVLLMLPAVAVAGAAVAAALLATFSIAMLRLMARGDRPSCRCFGQASATPIGPRSLLRNGALLALAAVVLAHGLSGPRLTPAAAVHRLGGAGVLAVALAIVTVALGAFCRQLFEQNGRILRRLDQLEGRLDQSMAPGAPGTPVPRETRVGRATPEFTLADFNGKEFRLTELSGPRPLVLFFLSAQCGPCEALLPDVRRWVTDLSDRLTIRIIVSGSRQRAAEKLGSDLSDLCLVDEEDVVSPQFGVPGTPSAVVVDQDLRFASDVAAGQPEIVALLESLASAPPPPPTIGDVSPEFDLSDQRGEQWGPARLAALGGGAVIFWDPACGFCRALEPQLLAGEAGGVLGRFLIVSSGPLEAAGEFAAPVLVDPERLTAQRFGISGTPIAVAIDDHGLLASAPAPGGPAVLTLLGAPPPAPAPAPVPVAPPVRHSD